MESIHRLAKFLDPSKLGCIKLNILLPNVVIFFNVEGVLGGLVGEVPSLDNEDSPDDRLGLARATLSRRGLEGGGGGRILETLKCLFARFATI
jgi:hypothetical protein